MSSNQPRLGSFFAWLGLVLVNKLWVIGPGSLSDVDGGNVGDGGGDGGNGGGDGGNGGGNGGDGVGDGGGNGGNGGGDVLFHYV